MDFAYPPSVDGFRAEVRAWLADNLPATWLRDPEGVPTELRAEVTRTWEAKLFAGRWICPTWPHRYGGRGLSLLEAVVLDDEFARANTPVRGANLGEALVGPTLMQWGTEEQKDTYIPPIVRGEVTWCQGFSEPDAGSDLASLRTRAELVGDEWIIDGQKVWTSMAHEADYIFLLARTDPEAPKHRGISFLLVPMRQPGIEIRPLKRLDGSTEFNEVYFTGARTARSNVVGAVNDGWRVATATLADERATSATTSHHRFARELRGFVELARRHGRAADPRVRQDLARAWSIVEIMRFNWYRTLTATLHDCTDRGIDSLAAINKMLWSEYDAYVTNVALGLMGPRGQVLQGIEPAMYIAGVGLPGAGDDYPADSTQAAFLYARSVTIWGGTSQIQRNIAAERVLGLPRG